MTRRPGVYLVCVTVLGQTLAGCALMSEQQKGGATGSTVGAATGASAGGLPDKKNPAQGAALGAMAGAALGGAASWAVGEYRVKQVRSREQAATAAGYSPAQGVVTKIERAATTPQQLKPGEQLTFQALYTVLAPPETRQIKVTESRTIYFDHRHLIDLPQKELILMQGTNEVQDSLALPKDAAEGLYLMMTSVEPAVPNAQKAQVATPFVVRPAASTVGTVAPTAQAPASRPTPLVPVRPAPVEAAVPPTVAPSRPAVLYVKISHATIRDGAGTRFKLLSQVPKGTRLQLLEAGGTDVDRWFRVRLANGDEGWVAASAVSPNP